jgi:quinol monooxygenase YgiN
MQLKIETRPAMETEEGQRKYLWSTLHHINQRNWEKTMDRFAILATLEARPGKEAEVEEFLKSAQPLVVQEQGTTTWFAFRIGPATFGIFDTFPNEAGRQAHLKGAIAKALFAKAEELFAQPPQIQQLEIFAAKPLS